MTEPPISKSAKTPSKKKNGPSSNWFELLKKLKAQNSEPDPHRKKRQKLDSGRPWHNLQTSTTLSFPQPVSEHAESSTTPLNDPELKRYVALDCEMVGVGFRASRSSLARVSLVNYFGEVVLDEYVQQREPVMDYRTRWSGITATHMINAKPFKEVQKTVNDLLDGRILVGHAVHNDLKALQLSHPLQRTRDTQYFAYKFALSDSPRVSLKNLAKQELGIEIQKGAHSSAVDAKATMAIYRAHRKDWEIASSTISRKQLGLERIRSMQIPETKDYLKIIGPISQKHGPKRKWQTQASETWKDELFE